MRIPRIYYDGLLKKTQQIRLDRQASQHILKALRLKKQDSLTIFNGKGGEFKGNVASIEKGQAIVNITEFSDKSVESPLNIHLVYGLARSDKTDFVIQKATELGVTKITPLITENSPFKLPENRIEKRLIRWNNIAISACEQSGRTLLPEIVFPSSLNNWLEQKETEFSLMFDPRGEYKLKALMPPPKTLNLLVGPESGFSNEEIALAKTFDVKTVCFGSRILRTETAAVAAISATQTLWGDL